GSAVSTVLVARAQRKTRQAYEQLAVEQAQTEKALAGEQRHAREAAAQRARAEKSYQKARAAVAVLVQGGAEELADRPQLVELRRRLLQAALDYYQDFVEERRDDPSSRADLAAAREQVATLLGELAAAEDFGRVHFLTQLLDEKAVRDDIGLQ